MLANLLGYLSYDIPSVGIGYVYGPENIGEMVSALELVYDLVASERPADLGRLNVQYRPLRDDYDVEANLRLFGEGQRRKVAGDAAQLLERRPEMERFIRDQSNLGAVLRGGVAVEPEQVGACYYGEAVRLIRANGEARSCCLWNDDPRMSLGNVLSESPAILGARLLVVARALYRQCPLELCRNMALNGIVERALHHGEMLQMTDDLQADPML